MFIIYVHCIHIAYWLVREVQIKSSSKRFPFPCKISLILVEGDTFANHILILAQQAIMCCSFTFCIQTNCTIRVSPPPILLNYLINVNNNNSNVHNILSKQSIRTLTCTYTTNTHTHTRMMQHETSIKYFT